MDQEPTFREHLRAQFASGRVWVDRAVVLLFAALSGGVVLLFTVLADSALEFFRAMQGAAPWLPLIWTPIITALVVWAVRRWAAGASGSGVPQVIAALDSKTPLAGRSSFVSLRLAIAKIVAVSLAHLAGLSMGRQGPSVQVAAGVMFQARRWLSPQSGISARDLLMAGGAAGLAAAFNTPLGGIVFAVEEMWRRPEDRSSGLMLAAIIVSGLVAVSVFGNFSYFGRVRAETIAWWQLVVPGTVTAVACGLLGGLFARLMIACHTGMPDGFCAFKRRRPVWFAAFCGLVVAAIGVHSGGATFGPGHHHTLALLAATETGAAVPGPTIPFELTWLKFLATWFSAWSGAPGGLFGPGLSIGASLGHDVATVMGSPHTAALIALGMTGLLAAVTQTPITAMIIVMEMTDGHSLVLSLMAAALVASGVSRLISRPLFSTMAELMVLEKWPPAAPAPEAAGEKEPEADAGAQTPKSAAAAERPATATASAAKGGATVSDTSDSKKKGPRAQSPLADVPVADVPQQLAEPESDDGKKPPIPMPVPAKRPEPD